MPENSKEQEIQRKYLKIELLNKEYEQLCVQEELIKNKIGELAMLKNSIDKIENKEGYSQVGAGVFVHSKIIDSDAFLVDIGKKLFARMNKNEVKEYLDKKLEYLKKINSQISERKKSVEEEIQKQIAEIRVKEQ